MEEGKNRKVIVGLSGGVDSAVTAMLLKKKGYDVIGVYMKLWREKDSLAEKNSEREEENARKVAEAVGVKFLVWNMKNDFKKEVVKYFLDEYAAGRTPNPCVKCNRDIKFGVFVEKALKSGADFVATGHYARIKEEVSVGDAGRKKHSYKLFKAKDDNKDQSYFLYNLDQKTLKKIIFPLGDFTKDEVREIARKEGLFVYNKLESQEVCFIGEKYYGDFLKRQKVKMKEGDIVDEAGNVFGKHRGLPFYTLGQRRDIRIGGTGPYFVIGIDYENNRLIVSNETDSEKLLAREFTLCEAHWIDGKAPEFPAKVKAKIRYRMEEIPATILKKKNKIFVRLSKKSRAVMPGQSAVFYQRDWVLGGGVIDEVLD
ncbi:MAG: tRNA 2-thiouridine(34) synthase MnmA [Candidatus Pacebacteria bacterium]|nr:tRNA 2-thiouridine(34) synthase MnmA [Candidatus Paceibacterota bacterium]